MSYLFDKTNVMLFALLSPVTRYVTIYRRYGILQMCADPPDDPGNSATD
jgi:hypothetical protein